MMYKVPGFHILWLVIILALSIGCRKDKDTKPPEVNVSSPSENASYNVLDNISVQAKVSDEAKIEFVSVRLVNTDLTPVLPTITLNPQELEYQLKLAYPIDNIHLTSGVYYIRVNASDGVNETTRYVKVNIGELPLERKGIILVSTPTGSTVDISLMDNNDNITAFKTLNMDMAGSIVSSYYQYINVLPAFNGDLQSVKISDKTVQWTKSTTVNFEGIGLYNETSYVCYRDNKVFGYNESGIQVFSAFVDQAYYPVKSFLHEDVLLVQEEEISGPNKRLSAYYALSGAYSGMGISMTFDIRNFASKDPDNVFLFANDNGQAKMLLLDVSGQNYGYWEPHSFNSGPLYDVAQVDNDNYIIAHQDELLWYKYSQNSLVTFAAVPGVQQVVYDALYNQVITAVGNEVRTYSYPLGQLIGSATHAYPISDLHVLYNK